MLTATFLLLTTAAWANRLPDAIGRQLPPGYVVLEVAQGRLTGGVRDDYLVALARPGDDPEPRPAAAPPSAAVAAVPRAAGRRRRPV